MKHRRSTKWREGFAQGRTEAALQNLLAVDEWDQPMWRQLYRLRYWDRLPDQWQARTPMSGEWGDEHPVGWTEKQVDDFQAGFGQGWESGLIQQAARLGKDCARYMLGGGCCRMPRGHRGRCAQQVFQCDVCGKTRRGSARISDEEIEVCFMCDLDWSRYAYPHEPY